jgi:CHAD domain-containing protein
MSDGDASPPDEDAIRRRAFELSEGADLPTAVENWLRAEHELAVAHDYDTVDRDLEQAGMTISRLPLEAGVVWRLCLPRGESVEEWEPGNAGLTLPAAISGLVDGVVGGKPLVPGPPLVREPGAIRLRGMIEGERRALVAHDPGSRLGDDPENLHQHRVAARRTRAFLRATRAYLDPDWRRALVEPLRELGVATGPARDLDVLLEHVREAIRALPEADRPGGDALVARLEQERVAARAALLAALESPGYRLLVARLRFPTRLATGVDRIRLDRVARKEFRRLAKTVKELGERPDDDAIHGLRMQLKRSRYAAELAPSDQGAGGRFLADARRMQDLLGEHQDATVAEERLRSTVVVDARTAAAFAAGRIAERQRVRRDRALRHFPSAWKRLRRSGRRLG